MKLKSVIATLAVATLALAGCSVDRSGDQADRPTNRKVSSKQNRHAFNLCIG